MIAWENVKILLMRFKIGVMSPNYGKCGFSRKMDPGKRFSDSQNPYLDTKHDYIVT